MKRNLMITLKFLPVFLFLTNTLIEAGAADTIRINLTYKHKLSDAGQKQGFKTIRQQFFTPEGVFFREINYDESSGQIQNYVFLFYRDGKLFTRECHASNDSILYILKYEYDKAGNTKVVTKLVPDTKNKILNPVSVTTYSYNSSGLLKREKTVNKKPAEATIKSEIKDYSYTDGNKISRILITVKEQSGKAYKLREENSYNEKGLLELVKQFGGDGKPVIEKKYSYLKSGAHSLYEETDPAGKKILLLQYDYKKHYMETGTQVSYYENL